METVRKLKDEPTKMQNDERSSTEEILSILLPNQNYTRLYRIFLVMFQTPLLRSFSLSYMVFLKNLIKFMNSIRPFVMWLLMFLVLGISASFCPPNCGCRSATIDCLKCLQIYFRSYSAIQQTCVCMDGFREFDPVSFYCTPSNCTLSSNYAGCAACKPKWKLSPNYLLSLLICICRQNYYFDQGDCACSSLSKPTLFYEDALKVICFNCPQGCRCDPSGCSQCSPQSLRNVTVDATGKKICDCIAPYLLANGVCVCPKLCVCDSSTGRMVCDPASHRLLSKYGTWSCEWPYTDTNYECVCKDPFITVNSSTLLAYDSTQQCMCKSVVLYSDYYLNRERSCLAREPLCSCNENGCYYCQQSARRIISGNKCDCIPPYKLLFKICACILPYYVRNDSCICLYYYNSTKYAIDSLSNACYNCPQNCECNDSGCYSCLSSTLRMVTQTGVNFSCYACQPFATLIDGVCRCNSASAESNGNCKCLDLIHYFRDVTNNSICLKCPALCSCNETHGCYNCDPAAFRDIIADGSDYSTCKCKPGAIANISEICVCSGFYNETKGGCDCVPYFYLNEVGVCSCLSNKLANDYYYDLDTSQCYLCPYGCSCNSTGCYDCDPNSLRYHYIKDGKSYCTCKQNAVLTNGVCRKCKDRHYYLSRRCVQCPQCLTCDMRGCTSCPNGFQLSNFSCLCQYPFLININGLCRCPIGRYFDNITISCQSCPPNCLDCLTPSSCLRCAIGVNRIDSPEMNCPCLPDYRELGAKQKYCCSDVCFTCNQAGCLSCLIYTNRQFNASSQSCVCTNNLVEVPDSIICGCRDTQYLFIDNWCCTCPLNCLSCVFIQSTQLVVCTSCRDSSNRNLTSPNCSCLSNFNEAQPFREYCYPLNCNAFETFCTLCAFGTNRQPTNGGLTCECVRGFYSNQYGQCANCQMQGCLACATVNYCLECNTTVGYILVGKLCQQPVSNSNFIFSQSEVGIRLQINTSVNTTDYSELLKVDGLLKRVYDMTSAQEVLDPDISLDLLSSSLQTNGILTALFRNPPSEQNKTTLCLHFVLAKRNTNSNSRLLAIWTGFDTKGSYVANQNTLFVYRDSVLTSTKLNVSSGWYFKLETALVVLVLLVSLSIYIKGYKHNQMPFFLQTLGLIAFVLKDDYYTLSNTLFSLNFCFYSLGNALGFLIPSGYLETSRGNFSYLTSDSNLLRVAGTTIAIAATNLVLIFFLRVVYQCIRSDLNTNPGCFSSTMANNRKYIYRFLEFLYKICMYPIVFFSIVTLDNWRLGTSSLTDHPTFELVCRAISAAIPAGYLLVTVWQLCIETVSKIYKLENLIEFVSVVLASMVLVLSMHTSTYVAVFVVFLIRALAYLFVRIRYLRDFQVFEYIKGVSTVLEMLTVWLVPSLNSASVIVFMVLTLCSQLTHTITVMVMTDKKAKKDKQFQRETLDNTESNSQLPSMAEEQSVQSSEFMIKQQ